MSMLNDIKENTLAMNHKEMSAETILKMNILQKKYNIWKEITGNGLNISMKMIKKISEY